MPLHILAPLVFLARLCDVSLSTIRVMFVVRGKKVLAAGLGFFEVCIWVLAVSAVITNITTNPFLFGAYAAGYACGILLGMFIEEKLALGTHMVRIVNIDPTVDASAFLREQGYIVTTLEGYGGTGPAEIAFTVVPRKKSPTIVAMIREHCPKAYITVEDIRTTFRAMPLVTTERRSEQRAWERITKFK